MSVINSNTQIKLLTELSNLGEPQSSDLLLLQRNLKSFKLSYGNFLSNLVDGDTIVVDTNKLKIADSGVSTPQLSGNSVTLDKLTQLGQNQVLGRVSSGNGNVEVINILDEDDMFSNSPTSLATQQSIKAYVDSISTGGVFTQFEDGTGFTSNPTAGTNYNLYKTHSFGQTPKNVIIYWRCISTGSGAEGYSVGDDIIMYNAKIIKSSSSIKVDTDSVNSVQHYSGEDFFNPFTAGSFFQLRYSIFI